MIRDTPDKVEPPTGKQNARSEKSVRRSGKAIKPASTLRQNNLEKTRQRARSRDKTQRGERSRTRDRSKARTSEPEDISDDEARAVLGESNETVVTLSLMPDFGMNVYAVELAAIVPGGGCPQLVGGRLDHGCPVNLINMKVVLRLGLHVKKTEGCLDIRGISRSSEVSKESTKMSFRIRPWPREFRVAFWILPKECMVNDVLFGRKFLERELKMGTNRVWQEITTAHLVRPTA